MSDEDEDELDKAGTAEPGSQESFAYDSPNVRLMDEHFLIGTNNEVIRRSYVPSSEIPIWAAELQIQGDMEILYAGGPDVETVRAVRAGAMTTKANLYAARDGWWGRMEHSQYNYDLMMPVKKQGGWLRNPFKKKQEEAAYNADQEGRR